MDTDLLRRTIDTITQKHKKRTILIIGSIWHMHR